MFLITNFMRIFSVAKRINKKITIQKADSSDKSTSDQASFLTESYSFDLPFFWKFTYIPRYVRYFNSFEAEKKPLVQSTKYEYNNSSELYKSTRYRYYVKTKVYEVLERIDKKMMEKKQFSKVYVSEVKISNPLPIFTA